MVDVGEKAPNFSLFDNEKVLHNISDFSGVVFVLYFFPLAFSHSCTTELCHIRDDMNKYHNLGSKVVAISVDSVFTLEKFKQDQDYNFPLLSDWNKDTSRAYGVLYEEFVFDMKGVAKRSAFVIDNQGIVRYREILDNADQMLNYNSVFETLSVLN